MHMPRKWRDTDFGRHYYTAGWQDAIAGRAHAYRDPAATIDLNVSHGQAALQAYDDGYKAGQAAISST